jgi:hypothetical protein
MEPKSPTFRTTLGLLAVVASLIVTIFVFTSRHNAQLMEQTAVHNAQLMAQTEAHNAQLVEQTAVHNAQLKAQTEAHNTQLLAQTAGVHRTAR